MRSFQSSGLLVCVLLVVTFVLGACGDTATVTPSPTTAAPTTTAATTLSPTTVATTTAAPTTTIPPTTIAIATPTSTPRPATTAAPTTAANTSSSFVVNSKTLDLKDSIIPQEYLDKGRKLRVLFTHMSVGSNILDGMQALSQQKPAKYSINIEEYLTLDWYKTNTGIGSLTPGMNNQPNTKIDAFKGLIDVEGYGEVVDVAMMKLGYDDFEDPPTITWESYRDTLLYLEKKYPKVKFVWWTLPAHGWGLENREAYNTLVRDYTKANNKILMDIADIESTDPQGNRITSNGVQALFSGYSEDGGHLNSEGSQRMARAMWWLLARLGGWNGQ